MAWAGDSGYAHGGWSLAVAVEDLHWADSSSVLLLHRLGRVAGSSRCYWQPRGGAGRAAPMWRH